MVVISIVALERRMAYLEGPMSPSGDSLWRLCCDMEHAAPAKQEAFLI